MKETAERADCYFELLTVGDFFSMGLASSMAFFFVMAMAGSFGNKTKPWMRVEKIRTQTMVVDIAERMTMSPLLRTFGTASPYLMVATAAVVMGKVYAHHATENLQISQLLLITIIVIHV